LCYQIEKTLNDLGEKVPGDVRGQLEGLINDLRQVKDSSEDAALIRRKMEELRQAAMKLGEQAYGGPEAPGAGTPGPHVGPGYGHGPQGGPEEPEGPDVVDGEFREV
jgi:hypothetical protein